MLAVMSRAPRCAAPAVVVPAGFSDDFAGNGALSGWTAYNPSVLPNVARVNGYYHSGTLTDDGDTLWYYAARGRADWKLQSFPGSGQPDKVYQFLNVGIGPVDDPTANLPRGTARPFIFCGVAIHTEDLTQANYEFLVAGHRGVNAAATLESKTTTNGVSAVGDTGANTVGSGHTHADIQLTLRSDNTVRWAYRAVGGGAWTQLGGNGQSLGGSRSFPSGTAYVGLVTYGLEESRADLEIPFVGICASATLVGE